MTDLTFIVEVILSISAIAMPIGLILMLLVAGDSSVTDLFMAPGWTDRGHGPAPTGEEEAPRWRLERLRPRGQAPEPVANASRAHAGRADAGSVPMPARTLMVDQSDR